jgi:polyphosphate kinase 2 (PPK2 family)
MFNIIPVGAPTDEELKYHYLWRFWKHIPRAGRFVIFDRSWYGRVLVERVEGFATRQEWKRAYAEINDFESQLTEHDMVVCKFWLHISPEEQLRRFQEREATPYKKFKITDDDYRNREKWPEYEQAANEMFAQTSTQQAPWHLVPANDKRWARVHVLKTACKAIKRAMD